MNLKNNLYKIRYRINRRLENIFDFFYISNNFFENIPAGVNGPHNEKMRNLRIISHLIIIAFYLYKLKKQEKYQDWIYSAIDYLSKNISSDLNIYINRNQFGKDKNNGLIGQVWILESLLYIRNILDHNLIQDMIVNVINAHKFDNKNYIWLYPIKNVRKLYIPSYTLNQQIWFGKTIHDINKYFKINIFKKELDLFFNNINNYLLFGNNTINLQIPIKKKIDVDFFVINWKKIFIHIVRKNKENLKLIELAYTPFTLWSTSTILNKLNKKSQEHYDLLLNQLIKNINIFSYDNPFSWGYNLTGVELSICFLERYNYLHPDLIKILEFQLLKYSDYAIIDNITYLARHYEYIYIIEKINRIYFK